MPGVHVPLEPDADVAEVAGSAAFRGAGRDAAWSTGSSLVSLATGAVSVPVTIRLLGPQAFGLSTVLTSLMAVLSLVQAGLGLTMQQAGARAVAGERDARDRLRAAQTTYCVLGAVLLVLSTAAHAAISGTKGVSGSLRTSAHVALLLMTVNLSLGFVFVGRATLLASRGRFRALFALTCVEQVGRLLALLVLLRPLGIVAVGVAALGPSAASWVLLLVLTRKDRLLLPLRPARVPWAAQRRLVAFALPLTVLSVVGTAVGASDTFVIGSLGGGVVAVTHFRVGTLLPQYSSALLQSVGNVLLPRLSRQQMEGSSPHQALVPLSRAYAWIAGLGFSVLAFIGPLLLPVFIDPVPPESVVVLRLFCLALALQAAVQLWTQLVIAAGRPGVLAALAPLELVVNLALTVVLVPICGVRGSGFALVASTGIVLGLVMPFAVRRATGSPLPGGPLTLVAPLAASAAIVVVPTAALDAVIGTTGALVGATGGAVVNALLAVLLARRDATLSGLFRGSQRPDPAQRAATASS